MWEKNKGVISLLLLVLILKPVGVSAQKRDWNLIDNAYSIRRSGMSVGVEYGRRALVLFGGEMQWKQLKLIQPHTRAISFDILAGLQPTYMGAQAGGWFKEGRTSLLFGGNVVWCTDFTYNRFGVAPFVGVKVWQAQLRAGVNIRPKSTVFREVNSVFLSLRFVFVNDMKLKKKSK